MADKFTVEDILSEYSESKKNAENAEENNIESVVPEEVKPVINEQDDDIFFGDSREKAADKSEEISEEELEKQRQERNSRNAAAINKLAQMKKDKLGKSSHSSPKNRASLKDMKLGLTGKIIPKTEEIDMQSISDNASFEEKSEFISRNRRKKVEDFQLETDEDYDNTYYDKDISDEESDGKRVSGQKEFEDFEEAPKILGDILLLKNNLLIRLGILLFTGVFSTIITAANDFGLPLIKIFDRTITPAAYLFTNTILGIIAIAVSYTVLASGIKNLLKKKADCDSVVAVSVFASVLAGIIILFEPESIRSGFFHVYISASIMGLVFNTIGKLMLVKRTERNFRYIAGEYDRYVMTVMDNEDVADNFTSGYVDDTPVLATMKKTEFVEDFIKNSYAPDIADKFSSKISPLIILVGLVVGLLSLLFEKNANGAVEKAYAAVAAFSGTIAMCSSMALMLAVNVPMSRASKKYVQYSAVMLGYPSVEEFADTNSLLVEAGQLFPNGMVDFLKLKMLSTTSIEECILMAASLSCQADSVLKPAFYKMLRGKTEMLYPVESYIYEDGQGLSGWIENKRILLGTRELMENHSIEGLPTMAKESEYADGNIVIYLSISGVVCTLFVVRAVANPSISVWLQELENEGIVTVVRTVDSFLSAQFLSQLFDIDEDSIKLLPFRYHKDYEEQTEYSPRTSASMLCSGHFQSFAMLVIGAKRLFTVSNLGLAVQFGGMVLGAFLSLIMMLTGAFSQISSSLVLAYNLILVVAALGVQHIKKL